jgi:hypothetical protein
MYKFKFIGGTDPVLDKRAFIEMDYGTVRSSSDTFYWGNPANRLITFE